MDKETLSNYGWIVICVLVLAVMIALAGPFGNFLADAVKSTTQGLFDVNQGALDAAGIVIDDNSFVETDGYSEYDHNAPELHPSGTIPQGAYYGHIYVSSQKVVWYTEMPNTVSNYDVYLYGDYIYVYTSEYNGWSVNLATDDLLSFLLPEDMPEYNWTDRNHASYGTILESINGKFITDMFGVFQDCTSLTIVPVIPSNVINMEYTFANCTSLTTAPIIPNGVTNMEETFYGCASLTTAPKIPDGVTNMKASFRDCTALTTAPKIPNTVTSMYGTFYNCKSLTNPPAIPNGVTNMNYTFYGCKSLTGTATINSNPSYYGSCFSGVNFETQNITLIGDSTILDIIGATGTNYCTECNGKCQGNH